MARTLVLLALFSVAAAAAVFTDVSNFDLYCKHFGKRYPPTEYAIRKAVYEVRVRLIEKHNAGPSSHKQGVNNMTDWTVDELQRKLGFSKSLHAERRLQRAHQIRPQPPLAFELPSSVDWTKKGAVTPVKNQGGCGSCWAFAGTEAIESAFFLATGKLEILGPQAFVDCVKNPNHCGGTGGCSGATPDLLFDYARDHGAPLESAYPYVGMDGRCKAFTSAASVTGWVDVASNNHTALMEAVVRQPVTIGVAANAWFAYSSGVLAFDECDADINHAVLLVGYGTDPELGDYWKVQNSWGADWGEEGFIRLARSAADDTKCQTDNSPADGYGCTGGPSSVRVCGSCGILYGPSFPLATGAV